MTLNQIFKPELSSLTAKAQVMFPLPPLMVSGLQPLPWDFGQDNILKNMARTALAHTLFKFE